MSDHIKVPMTQLVQVLFLFVNATFSYTKCIHCITIQNIE